jgi:hypothetical protein
MGRLVATGAIDEQEVAAALIEEGKRIGLGTTECVLIVPSSFSANRSSPKNSGLRVHGGVRTAVRLQSNGAPNGRVMLQRAEVLGTAWHTSGIVLLSRDRLDRPRARIDAARSA